MKMIMAGPMDLAKPAARATRDVLSFLEMRPEIDAYLNPINITAPISPFAATLLAKPVVAPFDVALVIHDSAGIVMSPDVFSSSRTLLAYVTHSRAQRWDARLAKRLNAFHFVIPADEGAAAALTPFTSRLTETSTPEQLVGFLSQIPSSVPMVWPTPKNDDATFMARLRRPVPQAQPGPTLEEFEQYWEANR
jgi:hypothetical protein